MQQENQTLPPSHFSPLKRFRKAFWIFLSIIALAVACLLVYVLFFWDRIAEPALEGEVKLTVKAPEESAATSELSYEITIENFSNTKLTGMNLEIFYPYGFTFLDSTPDSKEEGARKFAFADLGPHEDQRLVIVGQLEGSVQEIKILSAKLRYIPENFRSSFVAEGSAATMILAPDLTLQLKAPPHLVTGQTLTYEIEITNVATRPFSDLLVRLTYPEKFQFIKALPQPDKEQNEWIIASLRIGESRQISISGKIFEEPGRESFIEADLFLTDSEGERISAGRSFAFTQIRSSPLVLNHKLLGEPAAIFPGQSLTYEISYENTSEIGLQNVVLAVIFQSPIFELSKISSTTGQFRVREQSLVWIPAQHRELLAVAPGQKGKFTFSLPVSKELLAKLYKNPLAVTRVEFTSKELVEPLPGNTLTLKIQTELTLQASARIIAGKNPPLAGQATTYRIELAAINTVNDVKDAELTATVLGPDSTLLADSLTPVEDKDNVRFVPLAGVFQWSPGKIFAFSGSFHEPRRLTFDLNVIPTANDFVPELLLLREIQISGRDEFTGNKIFSNKIEGLRGK